MLAQALKSFPARWHLDCPSPFQARAQAALAAQAEAHRRELSGLQAALDTQVAQMEAGWRAQLGASQRALAEAANERLRMAADATVTSVQV